VEWAGGECSVGDGSGAGGGAGEGELRMMIGEQKRWCNRRVPILRIGAVVGIALFGFLVWVFYGEFFQNAVWSVCHQRTATFRGQALQVPWLWREEKWTNYNEFKLTRSYLRPTSISSVTVSYENLTPTDLQKQIDAMRGLYTKLFPKLGSYYNDDASINPQFICMDKGTGTSQFLFMTCYSQDGRWMVRMIGLERKSSDFAMILRGVDAMGTPSK
jgi:hypothetical protein